MIAIVGVATYFIAAERRMQARLRASLDDEADRRRALNAREYDAWHSVVRDDRRKADRRSRALRKFDRSRSPLRVGAPIPIDCAALAALRPKPSSAVPLSRLQRERIAKKARQQRPP